jgi:putative IMPACT (imprinted ancient) family translation regulator
MSQNVQKFYDGHEPVGGMPILEVMKMKGITAVCCAVVRYFGGVKLGVGGLARAFSGAAAAAINLAQPCEYVLSRRYELTVDYTYQGKLDYMLGNSHFETGETHYAEKIRMEVMAKHDEGQELEARIAAITNGNHTLSKKDEFYKNWGD